MGTFKDAAGRTWTLRMNVGSLRRVRTDLNMNLVGEGLMESLAKIDADPILLADVLFCILREDAAALKIDSADFCNGLAGDCIAEAAEALIDELALFTPNPRSRARVQQVVKAAKEATAEAQDRADKAMPQLLQDLKKQLTPGNTSGDLPASSASTPAP